MTTDATKRAAAILEADTLHRAGRITMAQAKDLIRDENPGPVAVFAMQRQVAADAMRTALQHLHRVCLQLDHQDQMQRPTEDEYQAALAQAAAALKEQ